MTNKTKINEAFDAIEKLALKGKSITQNDELKEILDKIHSTARYKFDATNQKNKKT